MDIIFTYHIDFALSAFTFIIITYLGFVVYQNDKTSATNKLFALLALVLDIYLVVNYISLHPPFGTPEAQLFWVRIVMAVTSCIAPILFIFLHTFPRKFFFLAPRYSVPLFFLMGISALASLAPFVFSGLEYVNNQPLPIAGPAMPIFLLNFAGVCLLSFVFLIRRYSQVRGKEKQQYRFLLIGVIASFTLMVTTTVISVVFFETSSLVFLGPISPLILMGCLSYAIIQHELFDLRRVATNLLIVALLGIVITRLFLAKTTFELVSNIVLLIIVVLLTTGLFRKMNREIELRAMNLRLQELDRQKTEFLSIAAHQLRTPLSVVSGYLELMKDGVFGTPSEKFLEAIDYLDKNNTRLVLLVDEFLDITRIEQGRTEFDFKERDLNALISAVVEDLREQAEKKGITIDWRPDLALSLISMDAEYIRHVISNFIDNAVQYSSQGVIRVVAEKEKSGITVRVTDQGVGFEQSDHEQFFQKFYRGMNVQGINVNYGTGLGLYVVKKFVEAHDGKVWSKSDGLGKGSEFGFWLPMRR